MGLPAIPAPTNLATLTGWVRVNANSDGVIVPANCVLLYAILAELSGNGSINLSIGTTNGGSDVVGVQTVPSGGLLLVPATSFSLIWFNRRLNQGLWLNSAAWDSRLVSAQLVYQPGP